MFDMSYEWSVLTQNKNAGVTVKENCIFEHAF